MFKEKRLCYKDPAVHGKIILKNGGSIETEAGVAIASVSEAGVSTLSPESIASETETVTATSVTATSDGLTTGLIPSGAKFVSVTSASPNNIITLPAGTARQVITGWVGANGCEIRTPAGSGATINNIDSDGTNEAAIPATTLFTLTCVATDTWILEAKTELGAVITAIVPDAA